MSTPIGLPPPGTTTYTDLVSFGPNANNAPATSPQAIAAARDQYLANLGFSSQDILIGSKEINNLIADSSKLNITLLVGIAPGGRAVTIQTIYDNLDPSNPKVIMDEVMLDLANGGRTQKTSVTTGTTTSTVSAETVSASSAAATTKGINWFAGNPYVAFVSAYFAFVQQLKDLQRKHGEQMVENITRTFDIAEESKRLIAKQADVTIEQAQAKILAATASITIAAGTAAFSGLTATRGFNKPEPQIPPSKVAGIGDPPTPPPAPPGPKPSQVGARPDPGNPPVEPKDPGPLSKPSAKAKYESDQKQYIKDKEGYDQRVAEQKKWDQDEASWPARDKAYDEWNAKSPTEKAVIQKDYDNQKSAYDNNYNKLKAQDDAAMRDYDKDMRAYQTEKTHFETKRQCAVGALTTFSQQSAQVSTMISETAVAATQMEMAIAQGIQQLVEALKTIMNSQTSVTSEAWKNDMDFISQTINGLDSMRSKIVESTNAALNIH